LENNKITKNSQIQHGTTLKIYLHQTTVDSNDGPPKTGSWLWMSTRFSYFYCSVRKCPGHNKNNCEPPKHELQKYRCTYVYNFKICCLNYTNILYLSVYFRKSQNSYVCSGL